MRIPPLLLRPRLLRPPKRPHSRPHHPLRSLSTTPNNPRQPIALPPSPNPPPLNSQDYDNPSPDTLTNLVPLPSPRSISARRALLVLSLPIPTAEWPSHLETMSPLLAAAGKWKSEISILGAYAGGEGKWPGLREKEVYPARLIYNDGKVFEWERFSEDTLRSEEWKEALAYEPNAERGGKAEVLVCTHGARDCRCSEQGGPLVSALRRVVDERGVEVPVTEVSHVGGHKWAANAIVLPGLDMLSNLREGDAGMVLDFALGKRTWENWRGRIGMSEDAQREFYEEMVGEKKVVRKGEAKTAETVALRFRTFEGEEKNVTAKVGDTLLDVAWDNNLPSMEGTCGGNLECATCHCYLNEKPRAAPIPEPSEEELDMLGYAIGYRDGSSRLGCQIEVTPELAKWCEKGGVIDLPRF